MSDMGVVRPTSARLGVESMRSMAATLATGVDTLLDTLLPEDVHSTRSCKSAGGVGGSFFFCFAAALAGGFCVV